MRVRKRWRRTCIGEVSCISHPVGRGAGATASPETMAHLSSVGKNLRANSVLCEARGLFGSP
ncbi:unnamed protein product [Ectocarpus sp. 12 AP-2014]